MEPQTGKRMLIYELKGAIQDICRFLIKWTCALLNNKWGGGCANILHGFQWQTGGEAEEVALNTSSSVRHLSFYSQLTRNMLYFGSTYFTWKPLRATNSRRMSLVPSKIRNILRSLITLSTPASCRSTTQEVHFAHWKSGCKTHQANKPGAAQESHM